MNVARQSGISVSRNPRAVTASDALPQTICENSTIPLHFSGDRFSYVSLIAAKVTCSAIDGAVNTSYIQNDRFQFGGPFDATVHLFVADL